MMKSLGFKLMDSIREVGELEITILGLESALFRKKLDEEIKNGANLIENSINSKATVYDVNFQEYSERIENTKMEYYNQVGKLREEYELQFVNSQLELREILENQKLAISKAKKALDMKYEKNDKSYNNVKDELISSYFEYDAIAKICEDKINRCLGEALNEIEKIVSENVSTAIIVKKDSGFAKFLNKIKNIFSGKSKFEDELEKIEGNINNLSSTTDSKVKEIRENTVEFVSQVAIESEKLNAQVV